MRHQSLLGGAAHFLVNAVTHPIKTVFNTSAGIKSGPEGLDKLITPVMGVGGLAMVGIGAINADPLLAGIGLTFASVAGGIYHHYGEVARTAERAKIVEAEKEKPDVPDVKPVEVKKSAPSASDIAEIVAAPETKGTGAGKRVEFRPNLPRPGG